MKYTTYSRFVPGLLETLNLQALLDSELGFRTRDSTAARTEGTRAVPGRVTAGQAALTAERTAP